MPTPPVLFMNAAGTLIGEVSNYASVADVRAAMAKALRADEGAYAAWSAQEKALTDPLAKAELHIDLGEDEQARAVLANVKGDAAAYLRGRLRRFAGDWPAMKAEFAGIRSAALGDQVRMERAYELWSTKAYGQLAAHLKAFPATSARYTEARYYEGLALFHQAQKDAAMAVWKATIKACSQDAWIYRADWAYTTLKKKPGGFFSSAGPRDSLLNRIGYMGGGGNPDLGGP